jgi:hypothetical protein
LSRSLSDNLRNARRIAAEGSFGSPLFVNVGELTLTKGKEVKPMKLFMLRPDISLYPGIRVDKDTKLEHHTENVDQSLENLVFHSVQRVKGDTYESTWETTVQLKEGDILIFDDGKYVKPVESFVSIQEALEDIHSMEDWGYRDVCSER